MVASDAVPKSQRDASQQENLDAAALKRIANTSSPTMNTPRDVRARLNFLAT